MTDDGGVLGNLPNSRPGKRSAKRDPGGRPAGAAAGAGAKPKTGARAKAAEPQHPAHARPPLQPEPAGDAVTAAVRTAAGLAVTGVRVAGAVTQELLKRLPRP